MSDREQWLKQMADSVSAAAQEGSFPDGNCLLEGHGAGAVRITNESADLLAYFEFHRMTAEYYGVTLTAAGRRFRQGPGGNGSNLLRHL